MAVLQVLLAASGQQLLASCPAAQQLLMLQRMLMLPCLPNPASGMVCMQGPAVRLEAQHVLVLPLLG